jgi:hypothetical protein
LSKEHPKATFGLNKFSDMSHQEFKDSWLMKPFQVNNTCIWPYHRTAKVESKGNPNHMGLEQEGSSYPSQEPSKLRILLDLLYR